MIDITYHHARQRARRTSATPAEYAAAIECYRPANHGWKVVLAVAAVLVLTAWSMKP
jgi:hypothetical protein